MTYRTRVRKNFTFFFSSRRRHTRYWRDWSSDVCSSDLDNVVELFVEGLGNVAQVRPLSRVTILPAPDGILRNFSRLSEIRLAPALVSSKFFDLRTVW